MTSAHAPLLFAAIVVGACAGSHMPAVHGPQPDPCVLVAPPNSPPESITVALSPAVDGAGQQRTTAEGFVVAQSYETLFGVDCLGRLYPNIAREWSVQRVEGAQRWEITLDTSARFWNGDRVSAKDVLAAWRLTANAPSGELARVLAPATTVIDDRTLSVLQPDSSQVILAHPSLAVYRLHDNSRWREGTGRFRIESRDTAPASSIALRPASSSVASRVRVHVTSAAAVRDALDAGADLLVTGDPAIVAYAAHNDALLTLPLPWDRTYVLLAADAAPLDVNATHRLTLADLLTDAVRADARIAEPPFWWQSNNHCTAPVATRPVAPTQQSSRVVYLSGDAVAQGVAERLVALAGSRSVHGEDSVLNTLLPGLLRSGARATAAALSPSVFAAALRAGDDLAYVLLLPRFAVAPCHEIAMLRGAAPWLESERTARGLQILPLIDTRSTAIVRRGRVGLRVDAFGNLRLLDGAFVNNGKP